MAAFLIVDPDRAFREALAIALRLDGHGALGASSADEARERIAETRFDCCIVDAHVPGADALLEAAASRGILAVATGRYPDLLAAAAARHPSAGTLLKPFRAADVQAMVALSGAPAQ